LYSFLFFFLLSPPHFLSSFHLPSIPCPDPGSAPGLRAASDLLRRLPV
jgi:hypothetical protein